jgi:hypothetical protein
MSDKYLFFNDRQLELIQSFSIGTIECFFCKSKNIIGGGNLNYDIICLDCKKGYWNEEPNEEGGISFESLTIKKGLIITRER